MLPETQAIFGVHLLMIQAERLPKSYARREHAAVQALKEATLQIHAGLLVFQTGVLSASCSTGGCRCCP